MNISVRMLKPDEIEDALDVIAQVFPDIDPDVSEDDIVLLAESLGKPVGFAHAIEEDKRIVLQGLGVEESARGQGIGRALMEFLLEVLSGSDKPIVLQTLMNNPAMELYHHFGFHIKRFGKVHILERKCEN